MFPFIKCEGNNIHSLIYQENNLYSIFNIKNLGIWNSLRLLSEKKKTGKHDLEKQRRKGVMSNQNWDLI